MKTRSLAALATIRARIGRRRRSSAGAWAHYDSSLAAARRFDMSASRVWPPRSKEAHEREIRSLSDRSGAPPTEVRALFAAEFARLKIGAKVGSYLRVLTESNVRGMLRRKARLAADADRTPEVGLARDAASAERRAGERKALRRWEDDGGSVSGRRGAPPAPRITNP
jgi:hypothetical protein